ncbi:MAG: (4Fe-4S)-binding protein [Lachnospiraceae bacterium]|nr:(4Fe-4S)-binding protein [Lachnospiraceae bacterium]
MHRLYVKGDITVFWDSDKCYHAKKCVTGCPEVFNINRKPWIDLSQADTAKIWKTVETCPSGALTCTYNHDVSVSFDEENCKSIAVCNGRTVGECDFVKSGSGWNIYHTEVNPEFGGRQIAKRLVFSVVEQAERLGVRIIPTCSYAAKILK